ncbi:trypsin [Pilimelia anulata]|uniref:Trypsin n=1 Tax=Pilimelia anulata TaxID=53371 RepID=A0A8J3FC66_9ACTN|nr:serine protease [Pilimelia anulata]GGK07484.1 trypsin [Pilimelia anulata]
MPVRHALLAALVTGLTATLTAAGATAVGAAPPVAVRPEPAPRIVGGTEVPDDARYPWMARIQLHVPKGVAMCGGSQVSPDIVVTAAHCFLETTSDGKPDRVVLDIGRIDPTTAEAAGQRRTGAAYRYGRGVRKSDWAVVKLDQPYRAAHYPRLADDAGRDTAPAFRAIGWGMTSYGSHQAKILREVDLPLVPDTDRRCADDPDFERPDLHICAGDDRKTTCMGDSGGPLLAGAAGDWTLVGITSWGYGCGSRGTPGFYAQVSVFAKEIRAAITALGGQQPGR